ncbi:MAG TPA: ABC transporter permease [Anaerolineales bacterium]|nr:ABC transporter permease [Anaerolineales bacterium]
MNAFSRVWIVFYKEIVDNLRDRRSVLSALLSTLIGPAILLLLIVILGKSVFNEDSSEPLEISLAGGEHAPGLVAFLEQNGAILKPAPADPAAAVRNGDLEVVMIIPTGYGEDFTSGKPATVELVQDSSRQSAMSNVQRARSLLSAYSQQTGAQRLLARGISPTITNALSLEVVDVSTPESQSLIFLNMMPYFIVMVVFTGGMYVIIDATAGERERGSLEPLLINPIGRREIVIGKLLASLPFAALAVAFTLIAFGLGFNVFPIEDYLGFQLALDVSALFGIFLISLPMVLLASAVQTVIVTFTRSFKEAQTYVGFLPLIPALPGLALAFLPVKPELWMMLIPTFGQQILINQLMRGEVINSLFVVLSTAATLLLALALVWVAIRLYSRERILFGAR